MLEILLPAGVLTTIFLGNNAGQVTYNVHSTNWVLFAQSMSKIQPIVRKTISKVAQIQRTRAGLSYEQRQFWEAVERCGKLAANRSLPDESVIDHLRGYNIDDLRNFLITRGALVAETCEKPELSELAYAIVVLEGADVSGSAGKIVQTIKALVFGKETWVLKKKYLKLPAGIRQYFEKTEYFSKPFNDLAILRAIESTD